MKCLIAIFVVLFFTFSSYSQEVTMFPSLFGSKFYEDDKKITRDQFEFLLNQDINSGNYLKKSKTHQTISWLTFGAGLCFYIVGVESDLKSDISKIAFIGALGSYGVSIGFSLSSNKWKRESILAYNKSKDVGSINFGQTTNGIGLTWNFK